MVLQNLFLFLQFSYHIDSNFNFVFIHFYVQSWFVTASTEKYGDNNIRLAAEEQGRMPIKG